MRQQVTGAPPEVDSATGGGGKWLCPNCGHKPEGLGASPMEAWLRATFHIRPAKKRCPVWRRDDGVGDVEPCGCVHVSHNFAEVSGDRGDYEVDEF